MEIRTLNEADVTNKKVLLRLELNVPIKEGRIVDDTRIEEALPTLKYLMEKSAKIIILSHMGRPKGSASDELKMDKVAENLSMLLSHPVKKLDHCIGIDIEEEINKMKPKDILMLENIRFYKEEENCDDEFSKTLAGYGEVYVNDAFGTAHRAHASTYGVAKYLPSYAGLLLEKEIKALSQVLESPKKPLTLIFGGAKIDTKIDVIKNFLGKADNIIIGGGIANTFLCAQGYDIGQSLYEPEKVDTAREILLESEKLNTKIFIPHDCVVADEINESAECADIPASDVIGDMKILDLGEQTVKKFLEIITNSKMVVWNGPVGCFEYTPFSKGSRLIAETLAKYDMDSILGGGETLVILEKFKIPKDSFSHVSTGGGAMLEFLSGIILPGIKVLLK
jgi:phosphoglycerate kinase